MPQSLSSLLVHIVFSTKNRQPLVVPEIAPDLFAYLGGIVRELDGYPLIINGNADHVHMLVRMPSKISVSDLIRVTKANSSRWVHETWPQRKRFAWQAGYGAFSVSRSNVDEVSQYVARQQEHHRKVSFQDEFLKLLKKHDVEYDERYIWN